MKSFTPLAVLSLLLTSCPASPTVEVRATARPLDPRSSAVASDARHHVVVVAIDGVRFADLGLDDPEGRTAPHLRRLASRGAALGPRDGATFLASGPNFVSLPGYAELLTGARSTCVENDCTTRPARTLVDEANHLPGGAMVIASWERIARIATGVGGDAIVSAGRSGGDGRARLATDAVSRSMLEAGERADPFPGHDDYRPDLFTAAIATHAFEERRPAFLFVALGDTDEYAHRGDEAAYLAALRFADQTVGALTDIASRWEGHQTTFVVTTDHGRSHGFRDHGRDHPESQRGFVIVAGPEIAARGIVRQNPTRYLKDVAPTVRELLFLPPTDAVEGGEAMRELFDRTPRLAALTDATERRRK